MIPDTTIDQREVDFYEKLADTWWDRQGPFWPLHRLNALRVDFIREYLCEYFDLDRSSPEAFGGLRVLDVGCGGGILSESMAKFGADVTGIDVVEKNVRIASLHAVQENIDIAYREATAAELAAEEGLFDVVLNMEVVEHVADPEKFMNDCSKLVIDGGIMVVATINRTALSWLLAIVGAEYILGWLPIGTHRWDWFRKPREIESYLASGGMKVETTTGVKVNPVSRRFSLTPGAAVNYMLVASKKRV